MKNQQKGRVVVNCSSCPQSIPRYDCRETSNNSGVFLTQVQWSGSDPLSDQVTNANEICQLDRIRYNNDITYSMLVSARLVLHKYAANARQCCSIKPLASRLQSRPHQRSRLTEWQLLHTAARTWSLDHLPTATPTWTCQPPARSSQLGSPDPIDPALELFQARTVWTWTVVQVGVPLGNLWTWGSAEWNILLKITTWVKHSSMNHSRIVSLMLWWMITSQL